MSNNPEPQTQSDASNEPMVPHDESEGSDDDGETKTAPHKQETLSIDEQPASGGEESGGPPTADVELKAEEPEEEEEDLPPEVEEALESYYKEREMIEEEGVPEEEFIDPQMRNSPDDGQSSTSNPQGQSTNTTSSETPEDDVDDGGGFDADEVDDLEDIDIEALEEQDWELGKGRKPEVIEYQGMKFLFTDLEDETAIVNMSDQRDQKEAFYILAKEVIEAPSINRHRWREQMTATDRIGLIGRIMVYLDVEQQGNLD